MLLFLFVCVLVCGSGRVHQRRTRDFCLDMGQQFIVSAPCSDTHHVIAHYKLLLYYYYYYINTS